MALQRHIKPLRDMRNVPEWALAQKSEENELRYHVHWKGHMDIPISTIGIWLSMPSGTPTLRRVVIINIDNIIQTVSSRLKLG